MCPHLTPGEDALVVCAPHHGKPTDCKLLQHATRRVSWQQWWLCSRDLKLRFRAQVFLSTCRAARFGARARASRRAGGRTDRRTGSSLLSSLRSGVTLLRAPMGIKHSSRCMLLRRKMAESESAEVSVNTFDSTKSQKG